MGRGVISDMDKRRGCAKPEGESVDRLRRAFIRSISAPTYSHEPHAAIEM